MSVIRPKNTKERGVMEFLAYKEGTSFVGVCLTLDIVEEGSDPVELMRSLKEAAELHVETVVKHNLSDDLLNRHAPAKYWKRYFAAAAHIKNGGRAIENFPVVSPYSSGLAALVA
jgi:predicted RNase H-like HicB family nuclease